MDIVIFMMKNNDEEDEGSVVILKFRSTIVHVLLISIHPHVIATD